MQQADDWLGVPQVRCTGHIRAVYVVVAQLDGADFTRLLIEESKCFLIGLMGLTTYTYEPTLNWKYSSAIAV